MATDSIHPPSLSELAIADKRILDASILIVEDNQLSQRILLTALQTHGFKNALAVSSGEEALQSAQEHEPDLIILDLLMPHMDGFALCKNIRQHKQLRSIPILVHTALEDEQARLSIFGMGASDLVRKPVNDEELIARCRIHLEKRYILKDLQDYQLRMEDDLSHARAMQNMLMPDQATISSIEYDFDMDIRSLFSPSFTIGGDMWGLRALPASRRLAIFSGDFTGHGVTAAINVFRLCTLIDKLPQDIMAHPAECLQQLNHQLFEVLPIELFATMFYGILDLANDSLTYCIAGSPKPLMLRKNNGFEILKGSGLPLAAIRSPRYREERIRFNRGDALMVYSDALIETPNSEGTHLQIEDVGAKLSGIPQEQRHAERLLQSTIGELSHFAHHGVEDDLTLNVYMRR